MSADVEDLGAELLGGFASEEEIRSSATIVQSALKAYFEAHPEAARIKRNALFAAMVRVASDLKTTAKP